MTSTRAVLTCIVLLGLLGCSDSGDGNNTNGVTGGQGGAGGAGGAGGVGGGQGGAGGAVGGAGGVGGAAGASGMTGGASGMTGGIGGMTGGIGGMTGGIGGMTGGIGGDAGGGTGGDAGDGAGGGGGEPDNEPPIATTCDGQSLYETDPDTGVPGPWPVGVKTVHVPITGGTLVAEVWYPAMRGSEAGVAKVEYDQRDWLPGNEKMKIPEASNKNFECDCYRDLPVDTVHGPYPVVIFIHGTGSFRAASMTTMQQWASRGFIAVAADHFGLDLTDQLGCPGSGIVQNVPRDLDAMFAGLKNHTGEIGFLGDRADMTRVGVGGHSQGGGIAIDAGSRDGVKILLPLAPLTPVVRPSPKYEAAVFVTGMSDSITSYSASRNAYNQMTVHKTLVGITGGEHLDVSDLCGENDMGQKGIEVANQYGVCGTLLLTALAQCGTIAPDLGPKIVNYITTAALEETLQCRDRSAAYSMFQTKFPAVGDFKQAN